MTLSFGQQQLGYNFHQKGLTKPGLQLENDKFAKISMSQTGRWSEFKNQRIKMEISKTIAISEKTPQVGKLVSRADKDKVVPHL